MKLKNFISLIAQASRVLKHQGIKGILQKIKYVRSVGVIPWVGFYLNANNISIDYAKWILNSPYSFCSREELQAKLNQSKTQPKISVLIPVYKPNLILFQEAVDSVINQIYNNWELCICDDCSQDQSLEKYLVELKKSYSNIKITTHKTNQNISAATNSCLEMANGDWVLLLDHDDLLHEETIAHIVLCINDKPEANFIYADEDKIGTDGKRHAPYFKPDFNYYLFLSHNYICHPACYRTEVVKQIKGARIGYEGAQDYDLLLRYFESVEFKNIVHIPRVLYHWREHLGSTALDSESKPYAMLAGERALNDHLDRICCKGNIQLTGSAYRAVYELNPDSPLVSIVIPTRDAYALISQCIDSILAKTTYSNYELVIVDNHTSEPNALEYLNTIGNDPRINIYNYDIDFNYSKLCNFGANKSRGKFILLLNNDIEILTSNWIEEMLMYAQKDNVGAVGCKLLYPNDTIQHAGVVLGIGGVAGHSHKGFPRYHKGYASRISIVSEFSAVTGAALLVSKDKFVQVGMLNEVNLAISLNDIDLCLKLKEAGYSNVYTPHAVLYHHESATRGYEDTPAKKARFALERKYFLERWAAIVRNDPAYNPNLTLDREDFSIKY